MSRSDKKDVYDFAKPKKRIRSLLAPLFGEGKSEIMAGAKKASVDRREFLKNTAIAGMAGFVSEAGIFGAQAASVPPQAQESQSSSSAEVLTDRVGPPRFRTFLSTWRPGVRTALPAGKPKVRK